MCNAKRTCEFCVGQMDQPGLHCLVISCPQRVARQEAGSGDLGWRLRWEETEASEELRPHWGTLSEEDSCRAFWRTHTWVPLILKGQDRKPVQGTLESRIIS